MRRRRHLRDATGKGIRMAPKQLGKPIALSGPEPVRPKKKDAKQSRFGWKLSDAARMDIEKIEANVRSAEQRSGSLILR